jgi:DNA-binding transcriptional MocR family regulator
MPTTGAKTPAVEAILHALHQHPNATAAELADHADVGRSTANKALANLAAEGRAIRQRGGRVNGRIIPDRWSLDSDAPTEAEQFPAAEAAADPAGETARQDGQHDEPTPQASGTSDHGEAEATTTPTSRATAPTDDQTSTARLGHGELRDLVCGYLAARPGQEFTPHQIAKALGGRSAGAVSNALTSKAVQHQVIQTSTRPRRYMMAPQPSNPAASAKAS